MNFSEKYGFTRYSHDPLHKSYRKIFLPDALVQKLLKDSRIAVEESSINVIAADPSTLWPAEREAIINAVPKRRREFTVGRILARRALARLDVHNVELAVGPDRVPIWPQGVVGSITHTHSWCAAAVTRRRDFAGIGIDVEHTGRLDESLWQYVLTDTEYEYLQSFPESERGSIALLIFSAKEAAFKAQYLLTRRFLGFHAMQLTLDFSGAGFRATLTTPLTPMFPAGHHFKGCFLRQGELVATAVTIEHNLQDST